MNLDFNTKICFDFLELFMDTNLEFFEQTQIGAIIDYIFEQNKLKLLSQNMLYVTQALMVSLNQLYPNAIWTIVA